MSVANLHAQYLFTNVYKNVLKLTVSWFFVILTLSFPLLLYFVFNGSKQTKSCASAPPTWVRQKYFVPSCSRQCMASVLVQHATHRREIIARLRTKHCCIPCEDRTIFKETRRKTPTRVLLHNLPHNLPYNLPYNLKIIARDKNNVYLFLRYNGNCIMRTNTISNQMLG